MEELNNIMYFDTDDEFVDFAINTEPTLYHDDVANVYYYDYDYTDAYNDAIRNDIKFMIKDKESKIVKRGCATRRIISKHIDNLI